MLDLSANAFCRSWRLEHDPATSSSGGGEELAGEMQAQVLAPTGVAATCAGPKITDYFVISKALRWSTNCDNLERVPWGPHIWSDTEHELLDVNIRTLERPVAGQCGDQTVGQRT